MATYTCVYLRGFLYVIIYTWVHLQGGVYVVTSFHSLVLSKYHCLVIDNCMLEILVNFTNNKKGTCHFSESILPHNDERCT
jgi:hypothetical protein